MEINKINELISKCKATIHLTINDHKTEYCSVKDYFNSFGNEEWKDEIDEEVMQKMIERDTIIDLHFYPDTPIGFTKVFHYDLAMAIDNALKSII